MKYVTNPKINSLELRVNAPLVMLMLRMNAPVPAHAAMPMPMPTMIYPNYPQRGLHTSFYTILTRLPL